ncbi:MAG: hypothetical protein KBI32_00030 [Phycisphaerae bacterium]|nr:hypothetical protein [Phycisphaerae bacterium]
MKRLLLLSLIAAVCSGTVLLPHFVQGAPKKQPQYAMHHWEDPYDCIGCHQERYADWSTSQMSRGFTGDFFQSQYFQHAVKDAERDPRLKDLAADCLGCHSPSAFLSKLVPPPPSRERDSFWNQDWPWLDSYTTLGQMAKGLASETVNPPKQNQRWRNSLPPPKQDADRGVFCDFCHSIVSIDGRLPFNHNYVPDAGPGRNKKRADLEFPWSPYHGTQVSELYESADLCGMCHNEKNTFGVWVKATHNEWSETMYAKRDIVCQWCHMPPREGKPAKMGRERPWNHRHWFGGGFTGFVEGAANVNILFHEDSVKAGAAVPLEITVGDIATGHFFPTGATEERDVWLHLGVYDGEGKELQHITIPPNPDDPNDRYFITSNAKEAYPSHSDYGSALARDTLPEGDRIYQDVFLDSKGKVTFGQWYAVRIVGNRLKPEETRTEKYRWIVPADLAGKEVYLKASLWYRRMADSHAEHLGIDKRPHLLVSQDEKKITVVE